MNDQKNEQEEQVEVKNKHGFSHDKDTLSKAVGTTEERMREFFERHLEGRKDNKTSVLFEDIIDDEDMTEPEKILFAYKIGKMVGKYSSGGLIEQIMMHAEKL